MTDKQENENEMPDTRLAKTAVNPSTGSTAANNENVPPTAPEKADRVYVFDYGGKVQSCEVVKRTAKQWKVRSTYGRGVDTLNLAKLGSKFFQSEADAWRYRVGKLTKSVEYAKQDLQNKRTQLGMAESELKRLGHATPSARSALFQHKRQHSPQFSSRGRRLQREHRPSR